MAHHRLFLVPALFLVPTLCVGAFCCTLRVANADPPPVPPSNSTRSVDSPVPTRSVGTRVESDDLGLAVPPGFEVSLYADDDLAHDIYSMTIDAKGRVAVAGRNYVKILHDDNADGRADRVTLFSTKPASGAHGMYFDGPDLVCTGDDAVMRLRDTNADGVADGPPEVWTRLRHPEHGANGVVKGPDGWFYVICGNDAEVTEKHATTPHSPVKKPNCGAIVRFSPDGKQSEIFAHGFRNPYDLDFNEHGHLFTVDADGERDQYLPWYAPNRLFDVAQGMHHGWVLRGWTRSWNRPEYFPDNVERLVEIGRGSPTGLVCYRHRAFPPKYRGGIFSACWTLGNIYYFPLTPKGSTYTSQKEIFLSPTGQIGFAPVDLAVGPAGDMFIAIGGRGTRGGVFRVKYKGELPAEPRPKGAIEQVLDADQPLASWSRAKWAPIIDKIGADALRKVCMVQSRFSDRQKIRAIECLTERFRGLDPQFIKHSLDRSNAPLFARALWSVGHAYRQNNRADDFTILFGCFFGARHSSLAVQRAAWEAMATFRPELRRDLVFADDDICWAFFNGGATSDDRRVRAAALRAPDNSVSEVRRLTEVLARIQENPLRATEIERSRLSTRQELALAWLEIHASPLGFNRITTTQRSLSALKPEASADVAIMAMRLIQLAWGDLRVAEQRPDLYSGYSCDAIDGLPASLREEIAIAASNQLHARDRSVEREAARLLGLLSPKQPDRSRKLAMSLRPKARPEDEIHFLIALSRLDRSEGDRIVTQLTAKSVVSLHAKINALGYQVSRNWPLVVGELFDELCKRDPGVAQAVVNDRDFGLPDHTLFAERMPKGLRAKAARKIFDAALKAQDDARWSAEMVALVGALPDADVLPKLRELWEDEPGLRDAIALVLAREPLEQDRSRLVTALISPEPKVIVAAAKSLKSLAKPGKPDEIASALRMLREYCVPGKHAEVRHELAALLTHWTDQTVAIDERKNKDLRAAYQPWFDWFAKSHPTEAAKMTALGEVDAAAWAKRLATIDFSAGDAARGRKVFDARSCNRCHGGNSRLGPDLVGVTRRFSRADLLTSIIDPNKDVSPLYQTTQLTTKTGQTHVGILIYESPESSLVQTGPDTTIRITDEDVSKRRPSRQSLMPTGLLNAATDQDLADLFAYMQSTDAK